MLEDDFCPDLEKFGIDREEVNGAGGDSGLLAMKGKTTSITNLVELEKNSGTPPFSGLAKLLQLSQNHRRRLSATHSGIVLAGPKTVAAMPSN